MRRLLIFFTVVLCAAAQAPTAAQLADYLTPNALKADVSFLASDALEGRGTPSRGLDIAAEYVAAQFRRAGLDPAGDDGYFQTAAFQQVKPTAEGLSLSLEISGRTISVPLTGMALQQAAACDLSQAQAIKVESAAFNALTPEQVRGKVLVVATPPAGGRLFRTPPLESQPALLIVLAPAARFTNQAGQLRDASTPAVPTLMVWDQQFREAIDAAKAGPLDARVSAHIPAPAVTPVKLRNVVGVWPGSDPALRGTYVLVTAHYDHLGIRGTGEGDHIFNGANDDASGTASIIEIANAFAAQPRRPRRSIVFIALFGEELGDLGSRYYARHPLFPLAKTVADVNLEQLGRTDDPQGPHVGMFNLTGFDFTDMPGIFRKAAEGTGIQVVKDEKNSDPFFTRSDNAAFAIAGVPSTTISVSYVFPDYHGAGDEWPKLDYENMAKVDRAIALAIYAIADSTTEPRWNAANPQVERFIEARKKSGHD